jgi:pimeloyl-ACP methyl ester carboxylesterase
MTRLHVEHHGNGPPIILTHGLGDDSTRWSAVTALLTDRYTVTMWDLPGHGRSPATDNPADYSRDTVLIELERLVDRTEQPVTLVGHSLGGYLSLALALRSPEKIAALVLIASGPGYRDPAGRAKWNAGIDAVAERFPIPAQAAQLAHQHDSWVIDHCHELRPPLVHVIGSQDTRYAAGARYLQTRILGSRLLTIHGAGHHPQQTHAPEVCAAITGAQ